VGVNDLEIQGEENLLAPVYIYIDCYEESWLSFAAATPSFNGTQQGALGHFLYFNMDPIFPCFIILK